MKNSFLSCLLLKRNMSLPVLLCLNLAILCSGCGAETYEQRLNETEQYFAYLHKRNQALAGTWSAPSIHFRPPLDFQEISAAAPAAVPAGENGEAEPVEPTQTIDPRQPDFADLKLPGLEGAWRTEVPVDLENETVDRPAYLYVLCNYSLLQNEEQEAAGNFLNEVNYQLSTTFDKDLNTEDFVTERFPRKRGYIKSKDFTFENFKPEMPIDGAPYEIQIYLTESGEYQAAILAFIPQNMVRQSKLQEQIDFSLETFELQPPQRGNGGGESRPSTQF